MHLTAAFMTERIVAAGLARPEQIIGCTAEEIRALEIIHEVKLPQAYRDFLAAMGRGTGKLFNPEEGYGVLFDNVKYLNWEVQFREVLFPSECPPPVPDTAFFIGTFQSLDYWYLDLAADPIDPPVWGWGDSWLEDEASGRLQLFPSIWEWVEAELEWRIEIGQHLARAEAGFFDGAPASSDLKAVHELLFRGLRSRWEEHKRHCSGSGDPSKPDEECPF